jgi:6-phosphogluconolactonase
MDADGGPLSSNREILVLKTAQEIASTAAKEFVFLARSSIQARGRFTVALSGGSTPKTLFGILANDREVPWDKIHLFWGDERHVPPDHPDSNFLMTQQSLLSKIKIPHENVHRIMAEEEDANRAAESYEHVLQQFFGGLPRFDLALLGMGPDGHTASLFPGTKALHETKRLVVSNWVGKFYTDRITMTVPVLNNAACVIFLVAGEDKTQPLKGVLEGPHEPEQLPSQLIQPTNGKLLWMVDRSAAKLLEHLEE